MERKLFQVVAGLTWLALPLTALNYWRAWDRLPPRIAVHFDVNWQPNGWTSREGSLMLALGTTAFMLAIFTIASYAVNRAAVSSLSRWAMVAVFYVALGFVYYVNNWIVDRNLNGRQPAPLSESSISRDLLARGGFPQGPNPAFLVTGDGAARSRVLSKRIRCVELHS